MNILDEIFGHKCEEVSRRKREKPLVMVRAEAEKSVLPLNFLCVLRNTHYAPRAVNGAIGKIPALIAEVKKASPSKGLLCPNFDPLRLARTYAENGAAAISVLTDEKYFQGHLDHLCQIRTAFPQVPLLRKDFLCDPYQVYEARAAGASAVLLIAACLDPSLLKELHALALDLGMAALVEVHNRDELYRVLKCDPVLVGINNRNLRDFSVSLETCLRLRPHVPPEVCLVAESGIHTAEDVCRLAEAGIDAILVGEALVTAADVGEKVRSLMGGPGRSNKEE